MRIKITVILISMLLLASSGLLSAGTWQEVETQFAPLVRSGHVAVYDSGTRSMVIMGDEDYSDATVYYLDLRTQKWIVQGSSDTVKRAGHSIVYDSSSKNRAIIFGGSVLGRNSLAGFENKTYTWSLDTESWAVLNSTGTFPLERIDHSAIYDSKNNRMIIFGGKGNDGNYRNDIYSLDLTQTTPSWAQLNPTGTTPPARGKHTAIYDPVHQKMLIFGGTSSLNPVNNDLYSLDLATLVWSKLSPSGTGPSERTGHTAVYDPNTGTAGAMIVFGGTNPLTDQYLNDTYILDLSQISWEKVQPGLNVPSGRTGHSAVYDTDNNRMIIFGGYNGSANLNNCYIFNVIDLWPPASAKEEVFNYPNPFAAGSESTHITFYLDNGASVSVSIFTLVGDLVKKWSLNGQKGINELLWDGRNGEGKLVENGGYICLIDKPGGKAKFKIAVLK